MHGRPGYCDAFKPVPNGAALFPHFLFELCVSGCMTVSYTHLDVYKRQVSKL